MQRFSLFDVSRAMYDTSVVPYLNVSPGACDGAKLNSFVLSVTFGSNQNTIAVSICISVMLTVTDSGQLWIVGGSWSE